MAIGDWWGGQSDATKAALLSGIFGVGSSVVGGIGAAKTAEANRQTDQANSLTDALISLQNQRNDQNTFWPGMTQKGSAAAAALFGDPLAIAAKRQQMAKQREFLFGGPGGGTQWIKPPSGSAVRMPDMPDFGGAKGFYTDSAMLQSELPYWKAVSQMTGGKVSPSFMGTGYGNSVAPWATKQMDDYSGAVQQDWATREDTSNKQINATQLAVQQALGQKAAEPQKKKEGFWKKLGKYALMAAPIIAAPFTAGMSLPLAMAIQGGIGAASGALTGGGVKGALLGGAIGAAGAGLPGGHLAKGAVKPAIGGFGGAMSTVGKTLTSPKNLISLGLGAAGGGNANLAAGTSTLLNRYAPSLNQWGGTQQGAFPQPQGGSFTPGGTNPFPAYGSDPNIFNQYMDPNGWNPYPAAQQPPPGYFTQQTGKTIWG